MQAAGYFICMENGCISLLHGVSTQGFQHIQNGIYTYKFHEVGILNEAVKLCG